MYFRVGAGLKPIIGVLDGGSLSNIVLLALSFDFLKQLPPLSLMMYVSLPDPSPPYVVYLG
jgi:hypothetical protein